MATSRTEPAVDELHEESPQPDGPPPGTLAGAPGVGTRYAGRIGRHATAYGAAAISATLAGLVSVAVFTRFLDPTEFGKMAVLSTVATIVTMIATLGVMQGTMRRIYGTSGDEEVGETEEAAEAVTADPRLTLSTGFALSTAIGAVLFLAACVWAGDLAQLFSGNRDDGFLIILAVGAGAMGGLMRFGRYILRLQLRSGAYLVVTLVGALGSIAVAIPLLAAGLGIEGVLIGFAVANVLAFAISLPMLSIDLRPAVSLREAKDILFGGLRYLPIVLSFQAVQLGDTLLVARFANFGDAGLYRVAQRIAMPVSYGTSVFQQSWGPMRRDLTHKAVERIDESRAYVAHLFTYYAIFVVALILTVAVFADQLVRLAAGQFGEAATLVPLTTISVAGHGWFIFSYRNAQLPGQIFWMIGLSLTAMVVFVAGAALLIPSQGAVGAPLAAIGGWSLVTFVMLAVNQAIGKPIPFEWRNLGLVLVLSLAVWAIAHQLLPDTAAGTAATVALLAAWAAALAAVRVVPLEEVRGLARYARERSGIDSRRHLRESIDALDGHDAILVDEVVRRRRPPELVAERLGISEEEVLACTVQALRTAAGGGAPRETDVALGELILVERPRAERDTGLIQMVVEDADPTDADLVKRAVAVATSRRRRR